MLIRTQVIAISSWLRTSFVRASSMSMGQRLQARFLFHPPSRARTAVYRPTPHRSSNMNQSNRTALKTDDGVPFDGNRTKFGLVRTRREPRSSALDRDITDRAHTNSS